MRTVQMDVDARGILEVLVPTDEGTRRYRASPPVRLPAGEYVRIEGTFGENPQITLGRKLAQRRWWEFWKRGADLRSFHPLTEVDA